ncbi:MAG: hypothetical protein ABIG95_05940 [Candidatus Woesearchaeota archaeon]
MLATIGEMKGVTGDVQLLEVYFVPLPHPVKIQFPDGRAEVRDSTKLVMARVNGEDATFLRKNDPKGNYHRIREERYARLVQGNAACYSAEQGD